MYQISCDGHVLYDPRDDELIVAEPKCKLEVNTVGEASFTIYSKHPHYSRLKKLKSVFEITQDGEVIFRGRMTDDSIDFYNTKSVDLEGVMAYFNDSIIRPFNFPDDFLEDEDYITAAESGNVIQFFLNWIITQHNSQVQDFQKFKLGNVTVSDPNNYLVRSSEERLKSWEVLKTRLFDSALGGYLCIRYEADGNYIDYLSDFELTNTQDIVYGENILDFKSETDAKSTYSAIIPIGAEIETAGEEGQEATRTKLTIESLADGDVTEDIVKSGDTLYSKSAVESYGWIYAPISETTWDDVNEAANLRTKGVAWMIGKGTLFSETTEIKALDLHLTDDEIQALRIYRYVNVKSAPHEHVGRYKLTKLDIDIHNPQNTTITVGDTRKTLIDRNYDKFQNTEQKIESTKNEIKDFNGNIVEIKNTITEQYTSIVNTSEDIILEALKSYTETSDFESFKETVESQLELLADEMNLKFTSTEQQFNSINSDLQEKFNTITKYFTFNINGLTIGQQDNPYKVIIDNDRYSMTLNGVEVMWISDGKVFTPEIEVTHVFKLFGYQIEQDDAKNVNCSYVGGE